MPGVVPDSHWVMVASVPADPPRRWLTGRGRHAPAAVSLTLSAVWAIAAVLLFPTQDFLADRLLVSGVPLVVAVATAVVALRERH